MPLLRVASCFSPYRGQEFSGPEIPEKKRENYKSSLSGPTPKSGENCPNKGEKYSETAIFVDFQRFFPNFGGSDQEEGQKFGPNRRKRGNGKRGSGPKVLRDFERFSEIFRIRFLIRTGQKSAEKC